MTDLPRKSVPTILVVTHYYDTHGGGIERVAGRLIREISSQGNFRFVWAASAVEKIPERPFCSLLPMKTLNILEQTIGIPWPVWGPASLMRLRKAVFDADIVWLHDALYLGNIFAFLWARRFNKPVVVTQHIGLIPYRNPILRIILNFADRMLTAPILKGAQQTVFVSDRVAEEYYNRFSFVRPVKIIPNGVDTRIFHVPPKEKRRFLREQFALKKGQPVMLFVGRFVEKKGLSILRLIATLLPEWRFWLVGSGPIDPEKWLLPNVHVFKGRSDSSLAELYQAADLLVLPSYGEGFPLVIQEAMACGLPVLCSPATAAGSFLAKPLLYLADVFPKDHETTANVWVRKLRNFPFLPLEKSRSELADFARLHWDWRFISNAYLEVFQVLVKLRN